MNIAAISARTTPGEIAPRPAGDAVSAAERQKAGAQFEAILVRQLLGKSLTSMLGSESGAAAHVYGDMLTDTIAQQLTSGQGLGLGRMIATQLGPRGLRTAAPVTRPTQP